MTTTISRPAHRRKEIKKRVENHKKCLEIFLGFEKCPFPSAGIILTCSLPLREGHPSCASVDIPVIRSQCDWRVRMSEAEVWHEIQTTISDVLLKASDPKSMYLNVLIHELSRRNDCSIAETAQEV